MVTCMCVSQMALPEVRLSSWNCDYRLVVTQVPSVCGGGVGGGRGSSSHWTGKII